jgi:hypothetical protein
MQFKFRVFEIKLIILSIIPNIKIKIILHYSKHVKMVGLSF